MTTSQAGISMIEGFESCRLIAYQDSAGVWTIGYGHTGNVDGRPVAAGMSITSQDAGSLLKADLQTAEQGVNAAVHSAMTQSQFDALVSLAFNVGVSAVANSTLAKYLNNGEVMLAAKEFPRWDQAGGKPLLGLLRRRVAEMETFLA